MNEKDIQYVLGKHLFLNNVCIPNVSMYCPGNTEYEADFVYFSMKTQFLTEVEIKTNLQDFKDDFNKKRYHDCKNVKYLYYAIDKSTTLNHGVQYSFGGFVKRAKERKNWYSLSPTGLMHYLRIGCMKWVTR